MIILSDMIHKLKYDNFYYIIIDMNDELYKNIEYSSITKKCIPNILNDEDIEFLVVIIKFKDKIKGEIRSKTNKDASVLALKFGGGGHKDGAGFTTSKTVDEIIQTTKDYLKDN